MQQQTVKPKLTRDHAPFELLPSLQIDHLNLMPIRSEARTALRIGRALGTTPEFWLNLQCMYDLDLARSTTDVGNIEPLVETSA